MARRCWFTLAAALFVGRASEPFEPLEPLEQYNWIGEVQIARKHGGPAGIVCPQTRMTVQPAACANDCRFHSAICVLVRNEARYLAEWLAYHRLVGIDHVYLYDNNSTDVEELRAVTRPFVDSGFLTLHDWSRPELVYERYARRAFLDAQNLVDTRSAMLNMHDIHSGQNPALTNAVQTATNLTDEADPQKMAYRDCIHRRRGEVKWLALIDADEYLAAPGGVNGVRRALSVSDSTVTEIRLPWAVVVAPVTHEAAGSGNRSRSPHYGRTNRADQLLLDRNPRACKCVDLSWVLSRVSQYSSPYIFFPRRRSAHQKLEKHVVRLGGFGAMQCKWVHRCPMMPLACLKKAKTGGSAFTGLVVLHFATKSREEFAAKLPIKPGGLGRCYFCEWFEKNSCQYPSSTVRRRHDWQAMSMTPKKRKEVLESAQRESTDDLENLIPGWADIKRALRVCLHNGALANCRAPDGQRQGPVSALLSRHKLTLGPTAERG